jgi:hypothetical protein
MTNYRYRQRGRIAKGPELTFEQKFELTCGPWPGVMDGFSNEKDMLAAWVRHRAFLIAERIKEKPCTRPWAWWAFESPEPRQLIKGVCIPFPGCGLWCGIPSRYSWPNDDNINSVDRPQWESESYYLWRLGLLMEGEKAVLETINEEE